MEFSLDRFNTSNLIVKDIKVKVVDYLDKIGVRDYFEYDVYDFETFANIINDIAVGASWKWDVLSKSNQWRIRFFDYRVETDLLATVDFNIELEPRYGVEDALGVLIEKFQ